MIEVFKTNVNEDEQSTWLVQKLLYYYPQWRINFDLEDCDNILRIEGDNISIEKIRRLLNSYGYECEALT